MQTSDQHAHAAEQMKTIKAAWDKAPSGAKKDNAHSHYMAAEKAYKANNDRECLAELEKAKAALH
jgi:predicted lipid-binding transport protein (Tim44 family)